MPSAAPQCCILLLPNIQRVFLENNDWSVCLAFAHILTEFTSAAVPNEQKLSLFDEWITSRKCYYYIIGQWGT